MQFFKCLYLITKVAPASKRQSKRQLPSCNPHLKVIYEPDLSAATERLNRDLTVDYGEGGYSLVSVKDLGSDPRQASLSIRPGLDLVAVLCRSDFDRLCRDNPGYAYKPSPKVKRPSHFEREMRDAMAGR